MREKPDKTHHDQGVLDIYKLLVEMADRVSHRRQAANSFYLTVNTAIIGSTAYLAKFELNQLATWAISVAGILICALWIMSVLSYKSLNSAKFKVITKLEERLPVTPYKDEWAILDANDDGKRHRPFHKTEVLVPGIFVFVHAAQIIALAL